MGPSSLLQVISRLKHNLSLQTTLPASRVQLLYREPGVESGYRPTGQSWFYYFLSVFQLNNETVNIWSHLIAAVIFVLKFFVLIDTVDGSPNSWPFVAFATCAVTYASLSTLAHTFHSKSPHLHYFCFQLDYLGIGLSGIGSNILAIYTHCPDILYTNIKPYAFVSLPPLAWAYVTGCCMAKLKYRRPYPPQRKLIQLVSGAFSVLPVVTVILYRLGTCMVDTNCSMDSLSHHLKWLYPFFLCLFFFSSHLPEKLYPGMFDIIGQGHQLFHVLVSIASVLQHEAGHIDLMNESMSHSKLDDRTMVGVMLMFGVYLFGCVVIIVLLKSTVIRRVQEDLKLE